MEPGEARGSLRLPQMLVQFLVCKLRPIVLVKLRLWAGNPREPVANRDTRRHAELRRAATASVLRQPILQRLPVHLLVLPLPRIDGGLRALQPSQQILVRIRDALQLAALGAAIDAPRTDAVSRQRFRRELRWLRVDVQHLLQEDTVLQLDLRGTILLQLPGLGFRLEVRVFLRSCPVDHAPGGLERPQVPLVLIALHPLVDKPVAMVRRHVPYVALEALHR
mmetsp:Transcript_67833/g.196212  ORF Transcript_67833/g.196212 Transcript_67833/m.196212 type:complete len:222 (-) Transcript_67833:106-771(-)